MIKIENVFKDYISAQGFLTKCLSNVSFEILDHEIVAICGDSGSGKTTLLNIMSCLDFSTSGNVYIDSVEVNDIKLDIYDFRLNKIGVVFQAYNLIDILTVAENIKIPSMFSSIDFDNEYYEDIVEKLGLDDLLNKFPNELSGGQQQRAAIARALINKPKIILADEPTGNLDSVNSKKVIDLLISLSKKYKTTLVIVTHDEKIAKKCDRIIKVQDGQVYEE